jgi:hypothetical protein
LEKLARALEVPMYQLFYDGEKPPQLPNLLKQKTRLIFEWGFAEFKKAGSFDALIGRKTTIKK